ncbi:MAG: 50S ribosomal protein L11 [Patescibacteria group bacterium]
MAKKVVKKIKLQAPGGKATPAPPIGTALGPAGVNIGQFVTQFNEKTRGQMGDILPVEISVYEDRTFSFVVKVSPASALVKKAAGIEKGSGKVPTEKAGKITKKQLREIAEKKMPDLNSGSVEAEEKIIAGTARSMGVDVV